MTDTDNTDNTAYKAGAENGGARYIYIDITDTYLNGLNTGIQRVVRNIAKRTDIIEKTTGMKVLPVIVKNDKLIKAERAVFKNYQNKIKRIYLKSENLINLYLSKYKHKFKNKNKIKRKNSAAAGTGTGAGAGENIVNPSACRRIRHLLKKIFIYSAYLSLRLKGTTGEEIVPKEGDILFFPDVFWTPFYDINEVVNKYRASKVRIVPLIHDIIPVMFKDYCDADFASLFRSKLDGLLESADMVITVSKSEKNNIESYIRSAAESRTGKAAKAMDVKTDGSSEAVCAGKAAETDIADAAGLTGLPVDYFYPGFDHLANNYNKKNKNAKRHARSYFEKFSDKSRNTFIIVGTIIPAKNHIFVVNAFERLWREGLDASLAVVGKADKAPPEILSKIKDSIFFNKNLFFFDDAADEELDLLYRNSNVLIIASVAEGFGLPLIEGLSRNLKIIASDIPVFKEIACAAGEKKDLVCYFKVDDEDAFINAVKNVAAAMYNIDINNKDNEDDKERWITWDMSVEMLSKKLIV